MLYISPFREGTQSFIHTTNSSYGRSLPLTPQASPIEHVYDTPTTYGQQNQMETTSFSPNASVLPRLGTLRSKQNTYAQKPVPVSNPQPGEEKDQFYEKIYNDESSLVDREEVYDGPERTDLGPDVKEVQESEWPHGNEEQSCDKNQESPFGSILSGSTYVSKVADDLESFTAVAGLPVESQSAEVARNPLYDKLKH